VGGLTTPGRTLARSVAGNAAALATLLVLVLSLLEASLAADSSKDLAGAQELASHAPRTIRVGKQRVVNTIADAARSARDGDLIEIEAGDYRGDTAVWTQTRLTIRGIGGRPRLIAAGQAAEGKGIWVVRGGTIAIEDITFTGARVPDRNGAGIRLESGKLTVRRCLFSDNEDGILVGNDPSIILEVEDSEFGDNGAGDGQSHNLYVGAIQRFVVSGSYLHHARVGHLVKSRARENFVYYNRLSDEPGGQASYELEFPSGGFAIVVGNLIEQAPGTQNPTIVSFGAEGYDWPRNELHLAHNTIVNDRASGGIFVRAMRGAAYVAVRNNVFVGTGVLDIKARVDEGDNWRMERNEFADPARSDYRLKINSRAIGQAKDPGYADGMSLRPSREYTYPVGSRPVASDLPLSPGAFQQMAK
jgi:parallel beta helix pectate lyase-like protein